MFVMDKEKQVLLVVSDNQNDAVLPKTVAPKQEEINIHIVDKSTVCNIVKLFMKRVFICIISYLCKSY